MFHRTLQACVLVLLVFLSGTAFAEDGQGRIASEVSLRPAPDAENLSGLLTPGVPVEVLERRGDWVKVRLEGWVRATAVEAGAPATAKVVAAPTPAIVDTDSSARVAEAEAGRRVAEAEAARSVAEIAALQRAAPSSTTSRPAPTGDPSKMFPVEGMVSIKTGRKKKQKALSTSGTSFWLLPGDVDLAQRDTDAESDARLAELDTEAARLAEEAGKALKNITNFTEATQRRDELKRERAAVLREREDLLAVRHGRHEQVAREHAIANALADTRGWFSFSPVPAGSYKLYGRLTREGVDVEWIEEVTVGSAAARVDLDETSARGLDRGGRFAGLNRAPRR